MGTKTRLPSQQFLVLGAADWLLVAAAFTLVQSGATGAHALLFAVGIVMAVAGLLRKQVAVEAVDAL